MPKVSVRGRPSASSAMAGSSAFSTGVEPAGMAATIEAQRAAMISSSP